MRYPTLGLVGQVQNPDDDFDPYKLADSSHDPHQFYPQAGKDSETWRGRIPNAYLVQINEIVASRVVPEYKTAGDFVRDAINQRLYWYAHFFDDKQLADNVTAFTTLERSRERMALIQTKKDAVAALKDEFLAAIQARSRTAAAEAREAVQDALDGRDGSDDLYRDELQHLLTYMDMEMTRL